MCKSSHPPKFTAQDIVRLTFEVAAVPCDEQRFDEQQYQNWCHVIRNTDAVTLVESTASLSSTPGKSTRDLKALREAIISEIERKNALAVISTMEKLDASATRLTWVSLVLAVVGIFLTAIQVLLAFR